MIIQGPEIQNILDTEKSNFEFFINCAYTELTENKNYHFLLNPL
jgi:hypothetical protein